MVWVVVTCVAGAGALGGIVGAILKLSAAAPKDPPDPGTPKPSPWYIEVPRTLALGAVAATLSWALYGPATGYYILAIDSARELNRGRTEPVGLTLGALAGAVIVGIGGARWLTSEVEKKLAENRNEKLRKQVRDLTAGIGGGSI